jgi:hypothetical protein
MSVAMHPRALHHMNVSLRQPHADRLLAMEAVACTLHALQAVPTTEPARQPRTDMIDEQ